MMYKYHERVRLSAGFMLEAGRFDLALVVYSGCFVQRYEFFCALALRDFGADIPILSTSFSDNYLTHYFSYEGIRQWTSSSVIVCTISIQYRSRRGKSTV